MDPWYYNRLSNASAKSQSGSGASHSDYHQPLAGHQPAPGSPAAVSSAPQLLLQAAHNSGHSIPPPFSPGFLTPNPYEFPLFPNASQYAVVSQHRALASAISSAKPTVESEMSHRENFSPAHHPSLAAASGSSFFEHQNAAPSSLGWSHQPNPQLPSPFGVLPHESVSNTSSGPPSKPASADYANAFNAYSSSHSLNHQLSDYKNYSDMKKESRSQSPTNSSKVSSASPSSVPYYQGGAIAGNNYASSESNNRSSFSSSSKYSGSSVVQPPQSCIVASPSVTQPSKDYRQQHSAVPVEGSTVYPDSNASRNKQASSKSQNFVPSSTKSSPIPVQTKAQTKVYPDVASSTEASHRSKTPLDTNQSSPISLSMMDSSTSHRYSSESNVASKEPLSGQSQRVSGNQHPYQQSLSHHAAAYYANSGGTHEANYHRSKSVESAFVSATNQNALECVNRRTSPHTSQSSPLGHAHSPAYPMYNSPMSSLPSPSPHQLSESTNPCQSGSTSYKASIPVNNSTTPLDASVIRPQGGPAHSVTYPSVITRAVATPEPSAKPVAYNETRAYDHDSTRYSKQCWESGSDRVSTSTQQQRDIATNMAQPQHSSRTSERQQPCYDSAASQASHDLSSFRGDPMSLVKNLQSLQQHQEQTCQAQPPTDDSRPGSKTPGGASSIPPNSSGKRRKSSEKQVSASNSMEYYNNRIPPPAHLNVALQQQQNGSYFPNYLSSPSTSRAYSGSQTSLHHTSNSFMGSQSQGLYMSPYFSPFHLPTSQSSGTPGDYQSTSSHSRALHSASEPNNEHVPSATVLPQVQETVGVETSKVVIPNIEEELSYLVGPILMMKSEQGRKNSVASGFEASYLKFLQGERESSPPPSRGAKKTWYKTKNQQNDPPKSVASCNMPNGGNTAIETVQQSQSEKGKTPAYDVEDDPRYFPLPKTDAQRRSLDSSDSDSDPGTAAKSQAPKTPDRKPIAAVAPRTATKQATKGAAPPNSQPGKRGRKKKPEVPVPRRETSRRKAKEKGSILLNADDPEDPDDDSHSDSDPAWTPVPFKAKPQNIESSEDENVKKKSHKKAAKLSGCVRKRARLASSDCDQTSEEDSAKAKKRGSKHRKKSESHQGVSTGSGDGGGGDDDPELYSFKVGEFVLMKSDLGLKWPPIWRVDGKTLLQKFESFAQKGETLYRNISTYSGWTPQNRDLYISIQVKFRLNSKTEKVVEFLRNEFMENNDDILESLVKTTAQFQENFEVYIQTLISQALDSNFLTEIFQERDEYFLTNVKIVDDIVADRRQRFLRIVKWRTELEASIATWPCYNVMFELGEEFCKNCAACDKPRVAARVLLYGQPYNSTTLEGCQADPKLVSEKDFLTCRPCLSKIELYNKVAHQKYLMFIECAKRVQEKRLADSSKDTTVILNELLADDIWLHQLFRNVRLSWAEIDRLEKVSRKE